MGTTEPLLDQLASRFQVFAPEWPGFGEDLTEGYLEDMSDFTLHGWDLLEFLGLASGQPSPPYLAGHSMGGKILFPIPNRRLSKRLYRITTPTVLVWGARDKLVPPLYGEAFRQRLTATAARLEVVEGAAHMLPYEQPVAAANAVASLLQLERLTG